MKLYLRYILPLFLILGTVTACTDNISEDIPQDPEQEIVRRTVLIYMVSENTLSTATENDIQELTYAANRNMIPEDCNILVYNDNTRLPYITLFNKNGTTTWKTWNKEQNSADSTVMLATLKDMIANYPSQHYALVLWSHGSGWAPAEKTVEKQKKEYLESLNASARQARAFGIDNGKNSASENGPYQMNISSVKWVLNKLGVHMDYILWDACLMQGIETAYELRHQADWLIGSPTETPGMGAPYHLAAEGLCNADMKAILDAYNKYYDNSTTYLRNFPLSFIKTSELDALAKATAPLIAKYFEDKDHTPEEVATAQIYSPRKFADYNKTKQAALIGTPIAYDLGSVMSKILTDEEYGKWRPLLDKAVPYKTIPEKQWMTSWDTSKYGYDFCNLTDKKHFGAISMNVPEDDYEIYPVKEGGEVIGKIYLGWNTYFKKVSWWKAGGWNRTGWNDDNEE